MIGRILIVVALMASAIGLLVVSEGSSWHYVFMGVPGLIVIGFLCWIRCSEFVQPVHYKPEGDDHRPTNPRG